MRRPAVSVSRFCSFQDAFVSPERRRFRRVHGLQAPLHPQQILGWLVLLFITVGTFLVLTPQLEPGLRPILAGLAATVFLVHALSHVTVLLLDPADPQVRSKPRHEVVPEFDRSKHSHVIENGRCHLCNITAVSRRTKHCSVCNKCVARFDHHCKWLNNCIGARNYLAFLICLVSGIASTLIVCGVSVVELLAVRLNGSGRMDNVTVPVLPIPGTGSIILISAIGILSAVAAILLIHLCFFHGYIACLGLTTYEYVRRKRERRAVPQNPEAKCSFSEKRYRFCEEVSEVPSGERSVYVCSTHRGQKEDAATREKRNFRLCFSYETTSDETSIEVSSQTVLSETSTDAKSSTPSPVSCCFSIASGRSASKKPSESRVVPKCGTMRRIQSFLRTRLRKNSRQKVVRGETGKNRKNKISPEVSPEDAEPKNTEQTVPTMRDHSGESRLPNKLPPLKLPRTNRLAIPPDPGTAIPVPMKRNQFRPRRSSLHKRPRFKMNSRVTQTAQLSPIPESEFSKPASPHSPPQLNQFPFPPLQE